MAIPVEGVVISADGHVLEMDALWERLPGPDRDRARGSIRREPDGSVRVEAQGAVVHVPAEMTAREHTEDELEREYRRDPTGGTDLTRRLRHQRGDGVHAEVIFPNGLLAFGNLADADFNRRIARAYNDWVFEVFAPESQRCLPAALIPVDEVDAAVAEVERTAGMGFRTVMIPSSFPWRPYDRPDWEPLWSCVESARIPLNFHVFTGNVFFGTDFASLDGVSVEEFAERRTRAPPPERRFERLSTTVMGMASGMGPIVHLTGGGVLERHPDLRFVVTEAECGWLAWTLHAMDAMQQRRRLGLETLPLRASDYFRRQGAVTISDDPVALRNLEFTGTDCILWGNDYPHDEGTFPRSEKFREQIRASVSEREARQIFAGNAARVYGFDLEAIAASVD
jgi:predicted TIM-barrel fold metal-dependent hydrolase